MLYHRLATRTPIQRGWSGDQKYRVTDRQGISYLLRISPAEAHDRKLRQFRQQEQVAELGIPMCLPVEFGCCSEGVYSLQSWVDGQDAEPVMVTLPKNRQYAYGLEAGRILRRIHTLPAPAGAEPWADRFGRKIDRKIAMYIDCPMKYPNGQAFLDYIEKNRHLLRGRPQSYQHGDYHIGNMMLASTGQLTIIDFDRDDFGDPWEEFNRIVWCAQVAPRFASGMVDGYFDAVVPEEFWSLLALYICSNTLSSLPWAIPFGDGEIQVMEKQAEEIFSWYDQMGRIVPTWYSPKGGIAP